MRKWKENEELRENEKIKSKRRENEEMERQ